MISTIVTPSISTLQVLALIAAILFAVGTVVALMRRAEVAVLTFAGLCLVALALMFGG